MHRSFGILLLLFFIFPVLVAASTPGESILSDNFASEITALTDLMDAGAYLEVLEKGEVLLPRVRAEFPHGSFDEAKILDSMVYASYRSRRVMDPQAITMGEQAIQIKEVVVGPDDPETAASLMHLGNLFIQRWEGEKSIPLHDRALTILEKAGPDFDHQRAIILRSQGVAYRRLSQPAKAFELYGKALAIQERVLGPDHPDVASTLNNQAGVLSDRGDYSTAEKLHRRAIAIREAALGADHEWVGESANNLASILGYMGKYDEALEYQERAVQIFKTKLGTEHPRYWTTKLNLGIAYLEMGDPAGALPICQDVLQNMRKVYGEDSPQTCYELDALASCHYELGDYELALNLYSQSLRITEATYGQGTYDSAATIKEQGKCLIALNRLDEAVERLNISLAILEGDIEDDNGILCGPLNQLAELHLKKEEYDRARVHAERSSFLSSRDLGEGHPLLAESNLLEARALLGLGDIDGALEHALLAEDISRRHLQQTMQVLSENHALDYAGTRVDGLDLAVSVLADGESGRRVMRVWDAVIRSRSVVLDEYTARNRLLSDSGDSLAVALMDSSLVLRERLANLGMRGPGWEDVSVYHQMLTEAEADLETIERQLSLHSTGFHHWQQDHQLGYEQVAQALPRDSTLLAFTRCKDETGSETYKVFILDDAKAEPRILNLGDAELIDAAMVAWRDQAALGTHSAAQDNSEQGSLIASRGFLRVSNSPEDQLADYQKVGTDLRRLVWDPVSGEVDANGPVFIVPDGSLQLLNPSSLPEDDGRFLVESGHIFHLLTSEKTLAMEESSTKTPLRLVAVGGVDYGLTLGLEGLPFSSLPHARTEVERLADIWSDQGGKTTLLLGTKATEENLKQELAGTGILHLATHGFFLPASTSLDGSKQYDNPLVRTGLALAGTGNRQLATTGCNDGLLTAEEVSALDLNGVQWAVLSACNTGLGELDTRGEGVFGLRRVFALAGARTVIMSLWSVEDESSCDWMCALYKARWQKGMDTAHAVREASLEMLVQRRDAGLSIHPYYWAGFVAAGDWR